MIHLGIDIAKLKFDVALLTQGKFKTKVFANDSAGIGACLKWLGTHAGGSVHACLEATGPYRGFQAPVQIGRAHLLTPVTRSSRMPSSALKKKNTRSRLAAP